MVAIKQVTHSASTDIRTDEPTVASRPETLRSDNGQSVKSVQQQVQKKMVELLARAKQRKKQAEEQLSPSVPAPMMAINSMPLSKQIALPSIAQQPEWVALQKQGALVQGYEAAEQPQVMAESRAKPVPVADKATEVLAQLTETLTQSQGISRDKGEQSLAGLIAATRDNFEMPRVTAPSSIRTENKEEMSDTPISQDMTDIARSAVEPSIMVTSKSERESAPSLPPAEKKESTLSNDRAPALNTQQLVGQQLATSASTVAQPEEVKTTPQAVMTAVSERTESEAIAGRRTLSYTFAQWKNSPVVTFELSKAGELTATTNSVEVQQALQDTQLDWQEVQGASRQLQRDFNLSDDDYMAMGRRQVRSTSNQVATPPHINALENLIETLHGDYQQTYAKINEKAAEFMKDVNTAIGKISDFIKAGSDGKINFKPKDFLETLDKSFAKYTDFKVSSTSDYYKWSPNDNSTKPIYTFSGDDAAFNFWQKKLGDGYIVKRSGSDGKIHVLPNLSAIRNIYSSVASSDSRWEGSDMNSQSFQSLQSAIDSQKNAVNSGVSQLLERFRQDNSTFETLIQLLQQMTQDLHRYNAGYFQ
ncbi:hypothetical protein ACF3VQ_03225 [Yersinia sp. HM-2024]|uniref:hypothetical protein n=1 Tax=Yersinia sp. HM-2024 TaxID=3344550 RepID=UPI00370D00AF